MDAREFSCFICLSHSFFLSHTYYVCQDKIWTHYPRSPELLKKPSTTTRRKWGRGESGGGKDNREDTGDNVERKKDAYLVSVLTCHFFFHSLRDRFTTRSRCCQKMGKGWGSQTGRQTRGAFITTTFGSTAACKVFCRCTSSRRSRATCCSRLVHTGVKCKHPTDIHLYPSSSSDCLLWYFSQQFLFLSVIC